MQAFVVGTSKAFRAQGNELNFRCSLRTTRTSLQRKLTQRLLTAGVCRMGLTESLELAAKVDTMKENKVMAASGSNALRDLLN